MERRGKSSPLLRQRGRPCKPHSMQETRTDRSPAASLNRLSPAATLGSDRCLSSTEPGLQTALANFVPHHFRCGTFLSFTEPFNSCLSSNYFSRLLIDILANIFEKLTNLSRECDDIFCRSLKNADIVREKIFFICLGSCQACAPSFYKNLFSTERCHQNAAITVSIRFARYGRGV